MTIGQKLSEKRRELGKTIKDVELTLKISSRYLEAIENDDFDKLPSPTYAKAFLSDYATFLGLDKDEIVEEFEALYLSRPEKESLAKPGFVFPEWSGTFLALVLLASLFFLSLYYLFSYVRSQNPPVKTKTPSEKELPATVPTPEPTAQPETTTPTETPPQPISEKVNLKVRITGKASWIRVIVDGEKVYEGMMRQGEEKKWEGQEIKLRVGNASSTVVIVNGKVIELGRTANGIVDKVFRGGVDEQ